jgi:hypothetical protein
MHGRGSCVDRGRKDGTFFKQRRESVVVFAGRQTAENDVFGKSNNNNNNETSQIVYTRKDRTMLPKFFVTTTMSMVYETTQQEQQFRRRERYFRRSWKMMSSFTVLLLVLSTATALNLFNNKKAIKPSSLTEDVMPSLTNWKLLPNGKITGQVSGHPVVPDGEMLTTAAVKDKQTIQEQFQKLQKNTKNKEPPLTVTTVKGTQYRLIMETKRGTFNQNKQQKQKQMGYYYSTSLPYDQQLAFLEELTASIKALEAQERNSGKRTSNNGKDTTTVSPSVLATSCDC